MSMIVTNLYCHPHHYSSFVQLQLGDILGEPSSAALAPCIRGCRGSLEPFSGENIQVSGSPQARVLRSQVLLKREFKTSHQFRFRATLTCLVEKKLAPSCIVLFDTCKVIHIVCAFLKDL